MKWQISFFNKKVSEKVIALPRKIRVRLLALTNRMEEIGPNLGMPHTRAMGDDLFEIRVKASEGIARVFYCVKIKNEIVILHSFIKKTDATPKKEDATPKKELDIAYKRLKEVKQNG